MMNEQANVNKFSRGELMKEKRKNLEQWREEERRQTSRTLYCNCTRGIDALLAKSINSLVRERSGVE
jgi:hypothetical protein